MYSLGKFIDTDYALIVQHDGWALNADNWRDQWLEYDYIGGLTHAALVNNVLITNYQWLGLDNAIVVQNGGFSLRSKRFMNALTDLGIMPTDHENPMLNNEDIQLTAFMRRKLEMWVSSLRRMKKHSYFLLSIYAKESMMASCIRFLVITVDLERCLVGTK